ncbi:MAG: dienelactone hydrolase family protein [Clostridia bacterium]|nr:dienelactone hydrolase family protein [Clostridia bacterium]
MKPCFDAFLQTQPRVCPCPQWNATGEFEGIVALTYDAATIKGQKTKAFAYLGYPAKTSEEKLPAVVLVHGGGGVAFLPWVKQWNERGYVAIAMSNTGDFPIAENAGYTESDTIKQLWHHGLCGDFCEDGYVNAPYNDEVKNSAAPIEEQWMYHAVAQTILAHNVLRADPKVDPDRIGIVGVSWGGIITSLAIGYDTRFAFAVPIYGSAYLAEARGTPPAVFFKEGENPKLWLAEDRLTNAKMPILWQCENSDIAFTLNSNNRSYLHSRPQNPLTRMSAVHNMHHSHKRAWARHEALAFADAICKDAPMLPSLVQEKDRIICNDPNADIISIRRFHLTEPMSYAPNEKKQMVIQQTWQITDLDVVDGGAKYEVTDEMYDVYFELTFRIGDEDLITTIPYEA